MKPLIHYLSLIELAVYTTLNYANKKSNNYLLRTIIFLFLIFTTTFAQAQTTELWGMTSSGGEYQAGSIFKIGLSGNTQGIIESFYRVDGKKPYKLTLCEANNGKLYSMTQEGGAYGYGVLFEYDPITNIYIKKIDFDGVNNGKKPFGSLMQASNGKLYGMTSEGGINNDGVLFEYDINTNALIKKLDFDGTSKGSRPFGALLQASNGKLYGLTAEGGLNGGFIGFGVLFEYNILTNTFSKKIDFNGGNGRNPRANLIQATNGKIYGLTGNGGINGGASGGYGVLFEYNINTDSLVKKIDFDGNTKGSFPQGSLLQASNGKLYGMTSSGGANGHGVLFEFIINGNTFVNKLNFDGNSSGRRPYGALIQVGNGKLYGLTPNGGTNSSYGFGVLFEYNISTNTYTKKINFDDTSTGGNPFGSLMQSSNGKLYGVTNGGGSNDFGVLFEYDLSNETLINKMSFYGTINGSEPRASLMKANNGKLYGMTTKGGIKNNGVLFEYIPESKTFIKKIDFDSISNGIEPSGNLIEASNGKLYGLTPHGGINNKGVLFEYNPTTNNYIKKIDFDSVNGQFPFGSLIQIGNGKFYGMTSQGGAYNDGVIFEYDLYSNTISKKVDFNGIKGSQPMGSLIQASNGKLYGLTSTDGINSGTLNSGVLFEYDPITNIYTKKIDFDGTSKGGYPQNSLMQASNGKLYGLTSFGGINNDGVLFEYEPNTNTFTKKVDFEHNTKGSDPESNLMQASDGNLYGATKYGGTNNDGVLFAFNPLTNTFTKTLDFNDINGSTSFGGLIELSVCYNSYVNYSITNCNSYTVPSGNKTYSIIGSYTVMDTLINTCGSDSIFTISLTIINAIDTTTLVSGVSITANQSGASYQWIDCITGSFISGETNQTFNAVTNGNYAVIITLPSCVDTSVCTNISNVGISKYSKNNSISMHPNPASNVLTIEYNFNKNSNYTVKIFDLFGRIILTKKIEPSKANIKLYNLNKGTYIIKVFEGRRILATEKLIKL